VDGTPDRRWLPSTKLRRVGDPNGTIAPSGRQYEIAFDEQRACIVEVGGGLRSYDVGGRAVLDPYPLDAICDGGRGATLIPWPNRLADGRYTFDGDEHTLPLTDPAHGSAIHGLMRWSNWNVLEQGPSAVVVGLRLHPLPGWPFPIDAELRYSLGPDGLAVETRVVNIGERACPLAVGHHPYLSPGAGTIDQAILEFEAGTVILTDQRMLPAGREAVAGTSFDFARARPIADLELDSAFEDLARDPNGCTRVRLTGSDQRTVELWADASYPLVQLFSGDTLAPARRRHGLAVEPMTAPANALATGERLLRLEPGQAFTGSWGLRLS
jgi:aldose 1-epimerase